MPGWSRQAMKHAPGLPYSPPPTVFRPRRHYQNDILQQGTCYRPFSLMASSAEPLVPLPRLSIHCRCLFPRQVGII
jgi:hypothetical protein